jgi:hypothetical protein
MIVCILLLKNPKPMWLDLPRTYCYHDSLSLSLSNFHFFFFFLFSFFVTCLLLLFCTSIYIHILIKKENNGELLLASYGIGWRGLKLITLILLRASVITSQREKLCRCKKNKNTEKDLNLSIYFQVLDRILCPLCLLFLVMIILATKQNV